MCLMGKRVVGGLIFGVRRVRKSKEVIQLGVKKDEPAIYELVGKFSLVREFNDGGVVLFTKNEEGG